MGRCLKDLLWLFAGLFPTFADAAFVAHFAGGGTVRVGASGFFLIIR
jgi:hypothetical protein